MEDVWLTLYRLLSCILQLFVLRECEGTIREEVGRRPDGLLASLEGQGRPQRLLTNCLFRLQAGQENYDLEQNPCEIM